MAMGSIDVVRNRRIKLKELNASFFSFAINVLKIEYAHVISFSYNSYYIIVSEAKLKLYFLADRPGQADTYISALKLC